MVDVSGCKVINISMYVSLNIWEKLPNNASMKKQRIFLFNSLRRTYFSGRHISITIWIFHASFPGNHYFILKTSSTFNWTKSGKKKEKKSFLTLVFFRQLSIKELLHLQDIQVYAKSYVIGIIWLFFFFCRFSITLLYILSRRRNLHMSMNDYVFARS